MMNKLGILMILGIAVLGVACTVTTTGSSGSTDTGDNANDNTATNDNTSNDNTATNDNTTDDVDIDVDGEGNVQSVPPAGNYIETIEYGRGSVEEGELSDFGIALGLCLEDISEQVNETVGTFSVWYQVGEDGEVLEVCYLTEATMTASCSVPECSTSFIVAAGCLVQYTDESCVDDTTDDGTDVDDGDVDDVDDGEIDTDECPTGQYPLYNYASLTLDEYICVDISADLSYECDQLGTTEWTAEGVAITTHTAQGSMEMVNTLGLCGTQGETLVIEEGDQEVVEQSYLQTLTKTTETVESLGYSRI